MKVVLELQDQPSNVRRITVRHDIVIGRGSDCNLRLSAPQVSRRHCFLRVGRDSVSVTDLDSSNGTFVGGKRIASGKRYDLEDGSELALGPIRFLIHMQEESANIRTEKADAVASVSRTAVGTQPGGNLGHRNSSKSSGSTHPGPPDSPGANQPMNYSLEHGGTSADDHENTADCINENLENAIQGEKFALEPPIADSRLEIIDFGRKLKGRGASDADGASDDDPSFESVMDGRSPLWESTNVDASPDDFDVLGISEDPADATDEPSAANSFADDVECEEIDEVNQSEMDVVDDACVEVVEVEEYSALDVNIESIDDVSDADDDVVEVYESSASDEVIDAIAVEADDLEEPDTIVVSRSALKSDDDTIKNSEEDSESGWFAGEHDEPAEKSGGDNVDQALKDFLKGF